MHITKIQTINWKGYTRTIELDPVTVIIGPNMGGKSAIAEAIRVGLIGYSPRHGKRNSDSFGFIGSPEGASSGSIALTLSDGRVLEHRWSKKRGSVKYDGPQCSLDVPPLMLDFGVYLSMTGPEKTKYVYRQIRLDDQFNANTVVADLRNSVKCEPWLPEHEAALQALVQIVHTQDELREVNGWTLQDWIEVCADEIKKMERANTERASNMSSLSRATSELSPLAQSFHPKDLEEVQKLLLEKRGTLIRQQEAERHNKTIAESRKRIEEDLSAAKSVPQPDLSEMESLEKAVSDYQSKTGEIKTLLRNGQSSWDGLEQASREWRDIERKTQAEMESTLKRDCCPLCRQQGDAWRESYATHMRGELKRIESKLQELKLQAVDLSSRQEALNESLRKSQAEDHADARNRVRLAELKAVRQTAQVAAARRQTLEGRLEALQPLPCLSPEDSARLSEEVRSQEEKLTGLRIVEREHTAYLADQRRVEQSKRIMLEAQANADVARAGGKVLAGIQAKVMEQAFGKVLGLANRLTDGFMKGPIEFRDGELGYFNGASWVGFRYFSGLEDLLAVSGLSVALAADSPAKIVLMDELGRFHPSVKNAILQRMQHLVGEGVLDQVIGLDVVAPDTTAKIIEL